MEKRVLGPHPSVRTQGPLGTGPLSQLGDVTSRGIPLSGAETRKENMPPAHVSRWNPSVCQGI